MPFVIMSKEDKIKILKIALNYNGDYSDEKYAAFKKLIGDTFGTTPFGVPDKDFFEAKLAEVQNEVEKSEKLKYKAMALILITIIVGFSWTIGTRLGEIFMDRISSIFGWPVG